MDFASHKNAIKSPRAWSRILRGSSTLLASSALALMALTVPASAALITNGSFETVGAGITNSFQLPSGNTTMLPGWNSTAAIACVVFPGTATTNACGGTAPNLWAGTTSPDGGNFFVMDIDNSGLLSQTLAGLIVGAFYNVSFYQAGAQFQPDTGATFENWTVALGAESHDSALLSTPSHGFTGWFKQNLIFKATSTSEVLSFFAVGSPHGLPPAIALDDVEVTFVPEPGTFALMGMALIGVASVRKRFIKRS